MRVHARATEPGASRAQNNVDARLSTAKYLQLTTNGTKPRVGVFEVRVREAASGNDIYVLPGQFGLQNYGDAVDALAAPATHWAYRRSQLNTPNGWLILATLIAALIAASIDGSFWLWDRGVHQFEFSPNAIGLMGAVSLGCKLTSAVTAFLLALWFKKS